MTDIARDNIPVHELLAMNVPLSPGVVTSVIGEMGRQLRHALSKKSDFPLKVSITTEDERTIDTTLESLYCDGSSQADGTYYFTDDVRVDTGSNPKHLRGKEIKTITILHA